MEKHLLICYDQHLKTSKNLSETQFLPGRAVCCMVCARHSIFPHTSPFMLYPLPQANDCLPFPSKTAVQLCCPALSVHMDNSLSLVQQPPLEKSQALICTFSTAQSSSSQSGASREDIPILPKSHTSDRYPEHTEALSANHFLLTPRRLELPHAPQQHPGLQSLM